MPEKYELKTSSGIDLKEAISTVQKEIRRGNERNAFLMCLDLIPRYEKYLWRRLLVISQEDIGLGDPDVPAFVYSQYQLYFEMRQKEWKDSSSCLLVLGNTILRMCRAHKSRLGDHFVFTLTQNYLSGLEKPNVPDYAVDKHTKRGREMGRVWNHFIEEGSHLENPVVQVLYQDPYHIEFERLLHDFTNRNRKQEEFPFKPQLSMFDGGDQD